MKTTALFLLLVIGSSHASWGQTPTTSTAGGPETLQNFFNSPDIILPRLYEAAIAHSGEIERLNATRDIAQQDVRLAKMRILSAFGLGSSYSFGTLPYYATAETQLNPVYIYNPFGTGARSQFNTAVNVSLPLDLITTRRTSIYRQELIVNQATAQRKTQEVAIHQIIISQYQALRLAYTTQQFYLETLQTATISKKIADKRFKEGELQVDEQMAALDLYSRAVLAQEEARNRYQTAQLLLEDTIGTSINNIMLGK